MTLGLIAQAQGVDAPEGIYSKMIKKSSNSNINSNNNSNSNSNNNSYSNSNSNSNNSNSNSNSNRYVVIESSWASTH